MGKSNTNNKSDKTGSYADFYYHFFRNILVVTLPLLIIPALILGFAIPHSSARVSSSDSLAISVPSSCTLSSSVDSAHSASIVNGRYEEGIGTTTLSTFCNDKNGYSVYAIGDSLNSEGNNTLVGSNSSNISSGTATSGDISQWAMKLALKAGDTSTTPPTIISPFDSYSTVPTTWTKIATIPSSTTDMKEGSNFTTTYATYISPTQAAGTYLGQVKYLLTHPSAATPTSAYIMQEVAEWEDDLPNPGDSVQAIDIRDGKQYWVTRLADGNIWMTQNLDFDISANTTLNSQTTDLNEYNVAGYSDGYTKLGNIIYWTPVNTTISFTGTTVTSWVNSNTLPCSANKTDSTETGRTSLGNYYNWTAAIASNNSSTFIDGIAKNSICPKNWRLPNTSTTNNEYNEFGKLLYNGYDIITSITADSTSSIRYQTGGFNKIISNPLYFVQSGAISSGNFYGLGEYGFYSTSTAVDNSSAYRMYFSNTEIWLSNNSSRSLGWSMRCVAR